MQTVCLLDRSGTDCYDFRKGTAMSGYHYQISEASRLLAVEAHVLRYWEEELGMIIPRNEMGHRYYTEEHLRIFSQIKDMKERGYQLRAIRAILSGEEMPEPVITEIPLKKEPDNQQQEADIVRAEHLDSPGKASVEVPRQDNQPVKIPRTNPDLPPKTPDTQPPLAPSGVPSSKPSSVPEVSSQKTGEEIYSEHSLESQEEAANRMNQFQAVMTHIIAQAMLCNNSGLAKDISRQVEADLLLEMEKMMRLSENRQEERFRKLDETMRSIQQGNRARYEAAAAKSPRLFGRKKRKPGYRRI